MKLLTFRPPRARLPRFGALLGDGAILDLSAVSSGRGLPRSLLECVRAGAAGLERVREVVEEAGGQRGAGSSSGVRYRVNQVVFLPPLVPHSILAVGRNYSEHVAETGLTGYSRPSGFVKLTGGLIGHRDAVHKPAWTDQLDYENELALIVGEDCADVPAERAYDVIFGYTIMNDVSARDIQNEERKEGNILVGKNFPTAAPLGPWVVTRDEIADPHDLKLTTRVSGQVRQDSNTGQQIFKIPDQIAWYSRVGLRAGDIISTGTPSGVAMGHRGPETWYLQPGDVVECEIEGIGVLANPVMGQKRGFRLGS